MSDNTESRLALQAARGIAALQLVAKLRDLANDAQADRDHTEVVRNRQLESINEQYVRRSIELINDHERQIKSLSDPDEDQDEDPDC